MAEVSVVFIVLVRLPKAPLGRRALIDGRLAVVSNTGDNSVSVVDVAIQKVVATVKVGASPKRLAVGSVIVKTDK